MPSLHPAPPARSRRSSRASLALLWLLLASAALCPLRAAPLGPNLFGDAGGFERVAHVDDNLWDGVDGDGYLCVFKHSAQTVMENGRLGDLAMPPSVAFVDLNGDGKPDLIVADPSGYYHFYLNRGTAKAPRFTTGEIMPFFLSTTFHPREHEWSWNAGSDPFRLCPRFALADWRHVGLLDFLISDYYGEFFYLPNTGTIKAPVYRQPTGGIDSARLATSEKNHPWGNLFAPVACDWNGDGKPDLIVGEGTYSANAIHLLENVGGANLPKFTDARHSIIAYGDGREQLIPTVADYDGDGNPDLIVADRSGEVGVYLNPGKPRPGVELKRASTITFGGNSRLPGLVAPYAADFNGDGLFDLIFGLPNGHIAVALNTGTPGHPAFGPPQDLKGEDRLGRNIKVPEGWETTTYPQYGNALAYFSVVNANDDPDSKPPEGANCLKAGYWPAVGELFSLPTDGIPGTLKHFTLYRRNLTINLNKSYAVSFKVKGAGMERMSYNLHAHYHAVPGMTKIERGERGEVKNGEALVLEDTDASGNFSVGSDWKTVQGNLTLRFKNPALHEVTQTPAEFCVDFWATSLSSVAYFDDFQLAEH